MKTLCTTISATVLFIAPLMFATDLPQGYVVGWGSHALYGCDGVRSPQDSAGVVTMAGHVLSNAVAITTGSRVSWALLSDGTVFGWGNDGAGRATGVLSDTEATNGLVKINGVVLSNVVAISSSCLALKSDGTVVGWGLQGNATNILAGLSNIVAIDYCLAIKSNGTIVYWGLSRDETPVVSEVISNVVSARPGWAFPGIAIKKDGTVVEWFKNGRENRPPVDLSNVVAVAHAAALNGANYLALNSDGTLVGWGGNRSEDRTTNSPTTHYAYTSNGIVTIGGKVLTSVKAIAVGPLVNMALKNDGTVIAWGDNGAHQTDVPAGLSNVVAIAAGDVYCLAITTNRVVAEKFRQK
jgi:alpha-tubulin suppressor-like RCC1 family protein